MSNKIQQKRKINRNLILNMANGKLQLEHIKNKLGRELLDLIDTKAPVQITETKDFYELNREIFIFTREELQEFLAQIKNNINVTESEV